MINKVEVRDSNNNKNNKIFNLDISVQKSGDKVTLDASDSTSQTDIQNYIWKKDGNKIGTGNTTNMDINQKTNVELVVEDSYGNKDSLSTTVYPSSYIIVDKDNYKNNSNKYPTTQQGSDNASDGSTILIKNGNYNGFSIKNTDITIKSEDNVNIDGTIITTSSADSGKDIKISNITLDTSKTAFSIKADTKLTNVEILSASRLVNFKDNWENLKINNSTILESSVNFDYNTDVYAKYNWWGSSDGPPSEVKVGTAYSWDRWCTNKECTDLSAPRLTDGSGNKFTTVQGAIDSGATDIDLESRTYDGFKILSSSTDIKGTGSTTIDNTIRTYIDTSGGYDITMKDLTIDTSSTAYATGTDTMMENITITSNNNRLINFKDTWENVKFKNSTILEESVSFESNSNVKAKGNWWGSRTIQRS